MIRPVASLTLALAGLTAALARADASPVLVASEAVFPATLASACVDLRIEATPGTTVSATVYAPDGERLTSGRTAIGRVVERLCRSEGGPVYVAVAVAAPARVALFTAAVAADSEVAPDGVETTLHRSVGPAFVAPASRRVAAWLAALESEGFDRRSDVDSIRVTSDGATIPLPTRIEGCALLVVAPSGADVVVGGAPITDESTARLLACGNEGGAVSVQTRGGVASVAFAFAAPRGIAMNGEERERASLVATFATRGLAVARELDVVPGVDEASRSIALPVAIEPHRCLAVGVVATGGHAELSSEEPSGAFVGHSASTNPSPRLYACAADEEVHRVVRIALGPNTTRARILVATEDGR